MITQLRQQQLDTRQALLAQAPGVYYKPQTQVLPAEITRIAVYVLPDVAVEMSLDEAESYLRRQVAVLGGSVSVLGSSTAELEKAMLYCKEMRRREAMEKEV